MLAHGPGVVSFTTKSFGFGEATVVTEILSTLAASAITTPGTGVIWSFMSGHSLSVQSFDALARMNSLSSRASFFKSSGLTAQYLLARSAFDGAGSILNPSGGKSVAWDWVLMPLIC